MTKYIYCKVCDKEIDHAVKKPMETFQKIIWVMVTIATLGIAGIVFAFYYMNKKKVYCPTCRAKVDFSKKPHKKPGEETEPLTTKERVLKKAGEKKEAKKRAEEEEEEEAPSEITDKKKEDQTFCPYCGEDIKPDVAKCPYCHSSLKTPY